MNFTVKLCSALWVFSLVLIPDLGRSATITVNPGDNLSQVIFSASSGDTVLVNAGTYIGSTTTGDPYNPHFWIDKSLILKAADPSSPPTLTVPDGTNSAVLISASDVTVDGFVITGANYGVFVQDFQHLNGGSLANINIQHLTITTNDSNTGHGISFDTVSNSVIDSCTIVAARDNGIYVTASSNVLVMGNTVQSTIVQHGIGITYSDNITVADNVISGSGFHGILLVDTDYSRVVNNIVSGHTYDGIDLTDGSDFNYVGNNQIPAPGLGLGRNTGTGMWFNSESDFNFAYGNSMSGSPENGFSVWLSSNNYLLNNTVAGNFEGGIFVWNAVGANTGSIGNTPNHNVLHSNYVFDNYNNGQIHIKGANNTDIAYNFLSGTYEGSEAGAKFGHGNDSSAAVDGLLFYENTMMNFHGGPSFWENVTNAKFFRNRLFNVTEKWAMNPAGVVFDNGAVVGGNFWTDHAAIGNPSQGTPYSNIIYDLIGHTGMYPDRFPYQDEHLQASGTYEMQVREPYAAQYMAAGTTKTIRWNSQGCVYVDISLSSATGSSQAVVTGYPDLGFYNWQVPAVTQADDYKVSVVCTDSAGAAHVSDSSQSFSIRDASLKIVAPGRYERVAVGSRMKVAWLKSSAVEAVDIYTRADANTAWSLALAGATSDFAMITLPETASRSFGIRVSASSLSSSGDSVDGGCLLRDSIGNFISPVSTDLLSISSRHELQWLCPSSSYSVDIHYINGSSQQTVATGLADFGRYTWLVPADWGSGSRLQIDCKDASGNMIAQLAQGSGGCTAIDDNLNMQIPCVSVANNYYQVSLSRYSNSSDGGGYYWRLGDVSTSADNGQCVVPDTDLNLLLPCVRVNGLEYQVNLHRYYNPDDSNSFFWQLGNVSLSQ